MRRGPGGVTLCSAGRGGDTERESDYLPRMIQVTALYYYPIKACRGIALREAHLDARGIVNDRRLMVVDPEGRFRTQRELPRMALIAPRLGDGSLILEAPGVEPLAISLRRDGARMRVAIWRDACEAVDQGDAAARWLTAFLEEPCRLVRIADDFVRRVDPAYAVSEADQVGFADGYPLLLTAEDSLADLNARMDAPLPMERFRPNVVVRGAAPFAEDAWRRIRLGALNATVVKSCARCTVTTVDQQTAERGKEPLRTLARFRHVPGTGVMFGQNVIHGGAGSIRVGDTVEVVSA